MGNVKKQFESLQAKERAHILIEAAIETLQEDGVSLEGAVVDTMVFMFEKVLPTTGSSNAAKKLDIDKRRALANEAQMLATHPAVPGSWNTQAVR